MKIKNLTYLFSFVVLFPLLVFASEVSLQKLEDAFAEQNIDTVVEQINLSKGVLYEQGISDYFLNIWKGEEKDANVNEMMKHEIVKINVADFIAQSIYNELINLESAQVLHYAREKLDSNNRRVVSKAIFILSIVGEKSDIQTLWRFISSDQNSDYFFRTAVMGLIFRCDTDIAERLENVATDIGDESRSAFIKRVIKKQKQSGHCIK